MGSPSSAVFWSVLVVVYAALAFVLWAVGVPSPFLFAGVLAGGFCAQRLPNPRPFPERIRHVGMAVIGVSAGSQIDGDVVGTVLAQPFAVLGGVFATLAVSMAVGQLLRISPYVNGSTAILASVAGGASGVSAVARELDADEAIVLSIQYLRVLFVLATVPVVAEWFGGSSQPGAGGTHHSVTWPGLAFTALSMVVGLGAAMALRFSASKLVLPMLAATGLSLSGVFASTTVPAVAVNFGYATTGLMVGLSFTHTAVRQLARLMPLALIQTVLGVGGCALVGLAFADAVGVSRLDGYLATTPGGLVAVTAIAIGSSANVGLVITMQLVRIFAALLLAPIIGAHLRRRGADPDHT